MVVKRLLVFSPLLATEIEVAPAIASIARVVYSLTIVLAAETVLAPFFPCCATENNEKKIIKKTVKKAVKKVAGLSDIR